VKIDQVIKLIIMAIVLMVAFSILGFIFDLARGLFGIGFKVLLILLVIAVVLRFIQAFKKKKKLYLRAFRAN